ncbi:oligosaccharide flippase family protein [Chlorobium sp. BLA1]|uniref:lipopolysaccharide biosynthesis protein n=1 Tax=Candidatus Chlorobium masyuteum TaxID=2716876 RepID=UPI00141DA2D4|nr:oligosaccharide flippase family protein [Candidatus Chlorobium masyuteum]NHQ59937.1 oligosaccharide flippase family protein [Candidatus Chlorobium masyuteum]NTU44785.1 oligosaccharide flippase family protein [Chlorobiaceae bacterium]
MFSKLKLLFKDTVIYGVSSILARSLNYLLVPLYANKLTTFDNGIQTIVYANIALANVLFSYGLETSYLKVASDSANRESDETRLFSTAFISLFLTSTLFALLIALFAPELSRLIGLSASDFPFIRYAALILWLDTLLVIPFAELRLKRKALQFAMARVGGVIAVVISALLLILQFNAGLHGVFIAEAFGSLVSLIFVVPVFQQFRLFFSTLQLREMLRIGLPYVPTGIAGLLIHLIDRNILIRISPAEIERIYGKGFEASDIVGIYGRIAAFGVVLQLFIQVFRFAWQPFFLQHSKDPDAKQLFRHILSISTLFTMFLALAASLFVPDLVRYHYGGSFYLLPPRYWIGLSVLPWIFLSYVFDMVSTNLSAGLLITGNTRYLPVVTFSGAAVTALCCWWLIPLGGMDGAAYAIVAGTLTMCLVMAWYSLRLFPVSHDWLKLGLFLAAGVALAWFQSMFPSAVPLAGSAIVFNAGLLLLYLVCAVLLFREEAALVAIRVRGKFGR